MAFGVFLIGFSYLNTTPEDRENIITYIKEADYLWVALSIFFAILSHLSRAYRWNFMLEPLGYRPKYMNSVLTVLITYLANLGIPRSGEVFRATAISAYEDIPFEKAFGTIVAERIVDLLMLFLIICIAVLMQTEVIMDYLKGKDIDFTIITAGVAGLLLFIFVFVKFIRRGKHPIAKKIKTFVLGLYEGVLSIKTMRQKGAFIFHTVFIWAMYLLMFFVIKYSFPETVSLPFSSVLVAFVAGALSMSTTNGGLGTYPIAVAYILSTYGISDAAANAYGWVMWISQTSMVVLFGGLAFLFLPIYNSKED